MRKLTTRLFACVLTLLCQTPWCHADNYDDNIAFMKNPPPEWKDKYPTCDVFLDVKWQKNSPVHASFPTSPVKGTWEGGGARGPSSEMWSSDGVDWIGMTPVDIFEKGQKKRHGLVSILKVEERLGGKTGIGQSTYIVSAEAYNMLNNMLNQQSFMLVQGGEDDGPPWNLYLGIVPRQGPRREAQQVSKWTMVYKRGLGFASMDQQRKNICLVPPTADAAWMLEEAQPFISDVGMSPDLKTRYQELFHLYQRDCPAIKNQAYLAGEIPVRHQNVEWCDSKVLSYYIQKGRRDDADGDGRPDFIFRSGFLSFIYFFYDEHPFIMRFPPCPRPGEEGFYPELTGSEIPDKSVIVSAQQCVAEAKKQHITNNINK